MKTINRLCLAVALAALVCGMTCSPSAQRTAYNTLGMTEQTVVTAVNTYADLLLKGQVRTNEVPQVSKAFNAFQQAYLAAVQQAKFDTNGVVTPDIAALGGQVISIINAATGAK